MEGILAVPVPDTVNDAAIQPSSSSSAVDGSISSNSSVSSNISIEASQEPTDGEEELHVESSYELLEIYKKV